MLKHIFSMGTNKQTIGTPPAELVSEARAQTHQFY